MERKLYRVRGPWTTRRFFVHNNVMQNLGRGLAERVFYVVKDGELSKPPQSVPDIFQELNWYVKKVKKTYPGLITPIDRSEFPDLYKKPQKRAIYQKAVRVLDEEGWQRKYSEVATFVKAEKIDATSKSDPAPRVIQPRRPEYNVELGVYLKPNEHHIYDSVARSLMKSPVIAKGVNALELGNLIADKWSNFSNPCAIGLDASRFDQHVGLQALKWEHSIYVALTAPRYRSHLKELLELQLKNRGVALAKDGGYRYSVDGCRMSGDMNTSLGNCLLMTAMTANLCIKLGVKYDMINNGDDLVLFLEKQDCALVYEQIPSYYLNFGFTMKVEDPVHQLEEIEFCQMHPVWTPRGYMMTRNYDVVLNKDLVTLLDIPTEKRFKQWMTAIGKGGLAAASGIPILQSFYNQLDFGVEMGQLRNHGAFDHFSTFWCKGLNPDVVTIDPRTRESFGVAFGISLVEQLAIEDLITAWKPEYTTPSVSNFVPMF